MLRERFKKDKTDPIDALITKLLGEIDYVEATSDEYSTMLKNLEQLYKLKAEKRRKPIGWDTIFMVGGNILGVLIVVAFEQNHVVTSKGLNLVLRPKSAE